MNEQNDRQNDSLVVEAIDLAGIDVLEEDIAAASGCCGCGCNC